MRYTSDVADWERAARAPFLALAKPLGRPRTINLWEVPGTLMQMLRSRRQRPTLHRDVPPRSNPRHCFFA
jgi:hypothetical protein